MRRTPRERVVIYLLALAVIGVWVPAYRGLDQSLVVTFLDVGQGDCILVESPAGRRLLIDGGGRPGEGGAGLDVGERVVLPALYALGVGRLDAVLLTHPQEDHVGGLPSVLQEVPVGMVLDTGQHQTSPSYQRLQAIAHARHMPVRRARPGQRFNLGAGIKAEVLFPFQPFLAGSEDDLNNNSLVLRLNDGEVTFLFPGDLEAEGEARLLASGADLSASVLKVAHHGSDGSTSAAFLRAVRPRVTVISVGENNPFGHPDEDVLRRLRAAGCQVLRTDVSGAITIRTDGRNWTIRQARAAARGLGLNRG